jgi:hypothetical protein
MTSIERLTAEAFDSFLGKAFRPASTDLSLTLTTIDRHKFAGWDSAVREPFSLILRGPRSPVLREGFHAVAIEDGPVLTLYIIPVETRAREHQDYQVAFN